MPLQSIDDVAYHYEEAGCGPPLVLLHGFTGSSRNWALHLPHLASCFRTIAIDLLGHGRTTAPANPERYGMARSAADLEALLARIVAEPVTLLGYSMGGRLALYCALAYPERVRMLILESASPGLVDLEARRERVARDTALAQRIEAEGIEAFVRYWENIPLFARQQHLPIHVREELRQQRLHNRPHGLSNSLRGMGTGEQPSLWKQVHQIPMPVHLIVGMLDEKFVDINRRMAAQIPKAELVVVPEAGHTVHLEQPQRFRAIVLGLCRDGVTGLYFPTGEK